MPSGNKPLPEPMLTQIYVAKWRHKASMSYRYHNCNAHSHYENYHSPYWLANAKEMLVLNKSNVVASFALTNQFEVGWKKWIVYNLKQILLKTCVALVFYKDWGTNFALPHPYPNIFFFSRKNDFEKCKKNYTYWKASMGRKHQELLISGPFSLTWFNFNPNITNHMSVKVWD